MFSRTALLTTEANDHSFTFGFARDFLRLRNRFDIRVGVLVFASEVHSQTTDQNLEDVVSFLEELAIPYSKTRTGRGIRRTAARLPLKSFAVS